MAKYSPDIAGIMSCLCDALTDDAHGIEGCVIQSSDNDNHDGEIFIEIPDGQGGMDSYLVKIATALCVPKVPRNPLCHLAGTDVEQALKAVEVLHGTS